MNTAAAMPSFFMQRALPMKFFKLNRRDLYHVSVPVLIATAMAPQTLAGSAVFLLAWLVLRMVPSA